MRKELPPELPAPVEEMGMCPLLTCFMTPSRQTPTPALFLPAGSALSCRLRLWARPVAGALERSDTRRSIQESILLARIPV
ncbi:hypothetical protein NDU88_004036 [Pleurodeles waltl]|uniref:Uncharacterized protein n=1 Tax=Pleurodeles waltl TaxID=8319 RepID=A0AAV7M8Q8_PLEWA|nr:hypothetical protein NDU88_004036 [Pleurodeles waltl]